MATFKDIVKQTLLKHCLEVTEKLRGKEEKNNKNRIPRDKIREAEKALKDRGWDDGQVSALMKAIGIASGKPEFAAGSKVKIPLFSVVVLEQKASTHGFQDSKPYISSYDNVAPANGYLLHEDGVPNKWLYEQRDDPRFATEEEVHQCIEGLTEEQMKTVLTFAEFQPVVLDSMNKQISISEEPEGGDVVMADGRTLMV